MIYLLFIDDDKHMLKINRTYFEKHHYTVYTARNQQEAESNLSSYPVDCIILDILMPVMDGYQLCRNIKKISNAPIIFLTSLTEKDCMYRGFQIGGADYITKPYDLKELELRIQARINQNQAIFRKSEVLSFPPLTIEISGRRALIDGKAVELTAFEFDILLFLARSPGNVFSLETIYREVWKLPDLDSAQTVRVHLARMRHKLEEACPSYCFIELVWGKGFLFRYEKKETC